MCNFYITSGQCNHLIFVHHWYWHIWCLKWFCDRVLCSVLETEKSLVLAEKGSGEDEDVELIIAGKKFRLVATMNPGGDFGKKEVSTWKMRMAEEHYVEVIKYSLNKWIVFAWMNQATSGTDVFAYVQLSPALRNRFTEIWCPQSNSRNDLMQIIQHNLRPGLSLDQHDHQGESLSTGQSIIKSLISLPLKYLNLIGR